MSDATVDYSHPRHWNAVVDKYERAFVKVSRKFAAHALRLAGVRAGMRVLDVCAGTGALTLQAAEAGATVDAVDLSPAMVARLRAHAETHGLRAVRVHEMDGQALDFPEATFDAAFSIFGLMFFSDRAQGLAEQHRVLKPGGRVAITSWNRAERVAHQRILGQALRAGAPDLEVPFQMARWQELQDPERFRAELAAAGFRTVAIHTLTETWDAPTPAALWDDMVGMSPAHELLFAQVGPARMPAVAREFQARVRAEFGAGPVALPGEVHFGIGEK